MDTYRLREKFVSFWSGVAAGGGALASDWVAANYGKLTDPQYTSGIIIFLTTGVTTLLLQNYAHPALQRNPIWTALLTTSAMALRGNVRASIMRADGKLTDETTQIEIITSHNFRKIDSYTGKIDIKTPGAGTAFRRDSQGEVVHVTGNSLCTKIKGFDAQPKHVFAMRIGETHYVVVYDTDIEDLNDDEVEKFKDQVRTVSGLIVKMFFN